MSKIKLTGDSSGYVEISAGDNAGNNTLELPTSGTKVVASDSSNNVNGLGIVTATTFSGALSGTATTATNLTDAANITTGTISNDRLPATITKNLTGDVTGNLTGNVTGGITTSQITIGDAFIKAGAVGVGTTDTTGRNAGVGTVTGTIIFNATDNEVQSWNGTEWVALSNIPFSATGGTIANYSLNGVFYRAHIFTGSEDFEATGGPVEGTSCDYLIVGGGGGGGGTAGGGAGGVIYRPSVSIAPGTYPVIIGAGGAAIYSPGAATPAGNNGQNSSFNGYTANGGGGGGGWLTGTGGSGGSGGGGSLNTTATAGASSSGVQHPAAVDAASPDPANSNGGFGSPGGTGANPTVNYRAAGGGGASAAGGVSNQSTGGPGGTGARYTLADGTNQYFAGGGGGGDQNSVGAGAGGSGGGGGGGSDGPGDGGAGGPGYNNGEAGSDAAVPEAPAPYGKGGNGGANTGGGGGGMAISVGRGGQGGSGVVIIRYRT